jgi:hypothetical protein
MRREYIKCRKDDEDENNGDSDEETYLDDSDLEEYMSIFEGGPILLPPETNPKKPEHERYLFN